MKKTTINLILTILLLCSGISVLAQGTFSVSVSTENNVSTFTVTRSDASYYTISYNLTEGEMPSGITNPDSYTNEDSFTLNNP